MAKQVARKTFKIELEVTVEMEQVEPTGAGRPLDRWLALTRSDLLPFGA